MSAHSHRWSSYHSQLALLEYASVQQACPSGIYVSTTRGAPHIWQGVYFVQKGSYSTSVLRFKATIPREFPEKAPSIIFGSELFHPLVVSVTNTFSNTSPLQRPQKAGDPLRLPPGSLNLAYGFPEWFRKRGNDAMPTTMEQRVKQAMADSPSFEQQGFEEPTSSEEEYGQDTPSKRPAASQRATPKGIAGLAPTARKLVFIPPPASDALEYNSTRSYSGMRAVLEYVVQVFEDDDYLDGVGVDDAANEGALLAWKAYRVQAREAEQIKKMKKLEKEKQQQLQLDNRTSEGGNSNFNTPMNSTRRGMLPGSAASLRGSPHVTFGALQTPESGRSQRNWDWNGVWLDRVRKIVKDSASSARLYKEGASGPPPSLQDDAIEMFRFLDLEKDDIKQIQAKIQRSQRSPVAVKLEAEANQLSDWANNIK